MQKMITLMVSLTILVLAVFSFTDMAKAAQVTRVREHKGNVFINGSEEAGFIVGAVVCFFSGSGEKLICGTVQRSSASEAMVKVNRKWARKIRRGTEALLYEEQEKNEAKKEKEETVGNEETKGHEKMKKNEDWFR